MYTWGKNTHSQLGYSCEGGQSNTPREVLGALKKIQITSVAAGKLHTAAISALGVLFTWGTNIGQIGN